MCRLSPQHTPGHLGQGPPCAARADRLRSEAASAFQATASAAGRAGDTATGTPVPHRCTADAAGPRDTLPCLPLLRLRGRGGTPPPPAAISPGVAWVSPAPGPPTQECG